MEFTEWLRGDGILFRDGGMGTMLMESGLRPGRSAEEFNVEHPEVVRAIHAAYAAAGANFILSNTFGGNRIRMKHSKVSVSEGVSAGVRLAKEAAENAGHLCFTLFDVGPLGVLLEPFGDMDQDEAGEIFEESVRAGSAEKPDAILIETMGDLAEMEAAVTAARRVTDIPIIATMTFDENGRLFTGVPVKKAMEALSELPVEMVGANCGVGPDLVMKMLPDLMAGAKKPVAIAPNAGLPVLKGDQSVYELTPERFAEDMKIIRDAGARLLGGCCGTTPDHIRAMVERCR